MENGLTVLANLATVATFIITLLTLNKVNKIEKITRVDVEQSSGKDAASRNQVRQEIIGDCNIQSGREMNA